MRKLIFALAAIGAMAFSAMAFSAPANAQWLSVGFGPTWGYGYSPSYWGGDSYGASYWGGPGFYGDYGWGGPAVVGYTAVPARRSYVAAVPARRTYLAVRERPRVVRRVVRERRIVRSENPWGAYAYSPGVVTYSSRPYARFGVGFGPRYREWYD